MMNQQRRLIIIRRRFRRVVVITSASHAEGLQFEPSRKHYFSSLYLTSAALFMIACLDFFMNCLMESQGCSQKRFMNEALPMKKYD